ncbi:hypothetical protein BJX64DRAFT_11763 [Aspergillus heterothallicus]
MYNDGVKGWDIGSAHPPSFPFPATDPDDAAISSLFATAHAMISEAIALTIISHWANRPRLVSGSHGYSCGIEPPLSNPVYTGCSPRSSIP